MDAAATNDEVDTLLELARVNDCAPSCKPNPEKAFYYYKQAAELGSPFAQYCVATRYSNGFGVLEDDDEAFRCTRERRAVVLAQLPR
jgi:TPR repeat protein